MKIFSESGFEFRFDKSWDIIKYDEHRFYRMLSGNDMSGVDFAGILNQEEAYLIEVKNFSQYPVDKIDKSIEELCQELIEKGKDSIQLIEVIQKYYKRKFLYKSFYKLVCRIPWLQPEWFFWTELHRLSIKENKVSFVLMIDSKFDSIKIGEVLSSELEEYYTEVIVLKLSTEDNLKEMEIVKM